jgi:hypothetical protein
MSTGLSDVDINKYFSVQELRQAIKQYGYDTSALFSGYTRLTKAQLIKLIIDQGMHFQLQNDIGKLVGKKALDIDLGKSRELPTRIKEGMSGDFKSKEEIKKRNQEGQKKLPAKPKLDYRLTMASGKIPVSAPKQREQKKTARAEYAEKVMVQNKLSPAESAMNKKQRGEFEKRLNKAETKYQKTRGITAEKQEGEALEQEMLAKAGYKNPTKKNKKNSDYSGGKGM